MRVMGASLVVALLVLWAGAPAFAITVDGIASPGEWDAADLHYVDPAPELPVDGHSIPSAYDVTDIYVTDGGALYFRMDVVDSPLSLTKRGVFLRYDFTIAEDPGAAYSISFNDGLGLPRGVIQLARFPDASLRDMDHVEFLESGTFVSGDILEAMFSLAAFPSVVSSTGSLTVTYQWWILESGPLTIDDGGEGPVGGMVPEPLTAAGVLLGCGMLVHYWKKGTQHRKP